MRFATLSAAIVLVSSLSAHADRLFTYQGNVGFSSTGFGFYGDFSTGPIAPVTGPTTLTAGIQGNDSSRTGMFPTGTTSSGSITSLTLDTASNNFVVVYSDGGSYTGVGFTAANYTTPGTYEYGQGGSYDRLVVTDVTPVSVTPEPSSIALLSTGLLGLTGVIRKRFI